MALRASAARPARPRGPALKFPCGHVESQGALARRTRATAGAVWVACRKCNLIALVVASA